MNKIEYEYYENNNKNILKIKNELSKTNYIYYVYNHPINQHKSIIINEKKYFNYQYNNNKEILEYVDKDIINNKYKYTPDEWNEIINQKQIKLNIKNTKNKPDNNNNNNENENKLEIIIIDNKEYQKFLYINNQEIENQLSIEERNKKYKIKPYEWNFIIKNFKNDIEDNTIKRLTNQIPVKDNMYISYVREYLRDNIEEIDNYIDILFNENDNTNIIKENNECKISIIKNLKIFLLKYKIKRE